MYVCVCVRARVCARIRVWTTCHALWRIFVIIRSVFTYISYHSVHPDILSVLICALRHTFDITVGNLTYLCYDYVHSDILLILFCAFWHTFSYHCMCSYILFYIILCILTYFLYSSVCFWLLTFVDIQHKCM